VVGSFAILATSDVQNKSNSNPIQANGALYAMLRRSPNQQRFSID
jgi:hypothetical protein